jgi:hypothetical protein
MLGAEGRWNGDMSGEERMMIWQIADTVATAFVNVVVR